MQKKLCKAAALHATTYQRFSIFYDNAFLRRGAQEDTTNHTLKLMLECLENRTDY